MSISKQQAKALAEGFLDSIGAKEGDFLPLESYTEFIKIAVDFVTEAQKGVPVHSGKLAASITAEEPQEADRGGISIDITMLAYGDFVNAGVRGTKGGQGKYAFKNDMPSKKMVQAFLEYIKTSSLVTASIKNHPISLFELKHTTISKAQSAFAMARSVKQHGIKAVHFIDKAAATTESNFGVVFQDALVKDVYNSLPDKI